MRAFEFDSKKESIMDSPVWVVDASDKEASQNGRNTPINYKKCGLPNAWNKRLQINVRHLKKYQEHQFPLSSIGDAREKEKNVIKEKQTKI